MPSLVLILLSTEKNQMLEQNEIMFDSEYLYIKVSQKVYSIGTFFNLERNLVNWHTEQPPFSSLYIFSLTIALICHSYQ